jgi:excisionase family DNA binding protein
MMNFEYKNECLRASCARKGSPFLATKEAANYLRLSTRTLEKMRMKDRGPRFRKHGRYVRYHIDDIEKWSKGERLYLTTDRGNP